MYEMRNPFFQRRLRERGAGVLGQSLAEFEGPLFFGSVRAQTAPLGAKCQRVTQRVTISAQRGREAAPFVLQPVAPSERVDVGAAALVSDKRPKLLRTAT